MWRRCSASECWMYGTVLYLEALAVVFADVLVLLSCLDLVHRLSADVSHSHFAVLLEGRVGSVRVRERARRGDSKEEEYGRTDNVRREGRRETESESESNIQKIRA
jgi:uncharacterized membrane protein